jgi:hypothetical protein
MHSPVVLLHDQVAPSVERHHVVPPTKLQRGAHT